MEELKSKYQETVSDYQPFVLAPDEVFEQLDDAESQFGEVHHVDSYGESGNQLTEMLLELDAQAYDGLPVENWVSVDACQETGGIIGLGTFDQNDPAVSDLNIPESYSDIVPVSEFSGGYKPGGEFVINTFSVADKQNGLGAPTAALATQVIPEDEWYAVAQFDNPSPMVYSKLGSMEIVEPQVPGHSKPDESFKFKVGVEEQSVEDMLSGEVENQSPDITVGVNDEEKIQQVQNSNQEYEILPPGTVEEEGEFKLALTEV